MHLFAVKNSRGPFITGAWYLMGALASNSFEDMPLTYEKLSGLCCFTKPDEVEAKFKNAHQKLPQHLVGPSSLLHHRSSFRKRASFKTSSTIN